jgi:hypothetical protein
MAKRYTKYNMTAAQMLVVIALFLLLVFGVIGLQAWLLGVVLGWFGVTLAFWQNVVIVLLIGMLFGGSRSSN